MKFYKNSDGIVNAIDSDGSQDFLVKEDWVKMSAEDIDLYLNPPLTENEILISYEQAIQQHLDDKAKELRYDNINSIAKYLGYENPFKLECEKLGLWCANCWVVAAQIEADVLAGTRTAPTIEEVIAELPVYA